MIHIQKNHLSDQINSSPSNSHFHNNGDIHLVYLFQQNYFAVFLL